MADASLNAMHQDRHEADRYRRIELITGTVRRRRWTIDEKAAIVAESTRPGVNVAEVARRFGVNRGLLQTWRRKAICEAPVFVPLRVESMAAAADNNKDQANAPRGVATRIPEQTCRRGVEWVNFRSVSRFDLSSSSREPFVRVPLHVGRVLACGRATVASPGPEFRTSLGAAA